MKDFSLSPEARAALAAHHRFVQGGIAVLANRRFGLNAAHDPQPIAKEEGGVVVNGREIAIRARGYVIDDIAKPMEPTPEEIAVAEAIAEIEALWRRDGAEALAVFPMARRGEPLRDLFGLA